MHNHTKYQTHNIVLFNRFKITNWGMADIYFRPNGCCDDMTCDSAFRLDDWFSSRWW